MRVHLFLFFLLSFTGNSETLITKPAGEINFKNVSSTGVKKDTANINSLNKLAASYFNSNPDSTLYLGQKSIDLSRKVNYAPGLAYALQQVGRAYYYRGNYSDAVKALDEAISIFKTLKDKTGLGASYIFYGQLFNYKANFNESIRYLNLALEINQQQQNSFGIADCYNNFGMAYFDQGKLSTALDYYYKALFICIKAHNNTQNAILYNNIGDVLQGLGEYPKALEHYKNALKYANEANNLRQIGYACANMGEIWLAQQKVDEAIDYLSKAVKIANTMDDKKLFSYANTDLGLCYSYKNQFTIAKKYFETSLAISRESKILNYEAFAAASYSTLLNLQKDYKKALKYAIDGRDMAIRAGNTVLLKHAVLELYKSYAGQGQFKSAFKYSNQYNELQDSLKNAAGIEKLTTYNLILNFNEKLRQIDIHQREKEVAYRQKIKQQKVNLVFIVIILIAFVIATFYYIQKKRQQKTILMLGSKNAEIVAQKNTLTDQARKLNESNELKDLLIGILAHDFRAPLSTLNGLFYLLGDDMITHDEMLAMVPGVLKQLKYTSDFLDTLLF